IKSLSAEAVAKLGDRGIVTLNQLLRLKADEIAGMMGASLEEADRLREIAEKIISSPRQT
ncbi:MAG: hypothetical protein QXW02_04800, partial [Nitrososphaerota archaeon]